MKISNYIYILVGCMIATFSSIEAYGKRTLNSTEPSRGKDGAHGSSGYFEDGENGGDGKRGKNMEDGGHGGNGGGSVYRNGGNGGNGGMEVIPISVINFHFK